MLTLKREQADHGYERATFTLIDRSGDVVAEVIVLAADRDGWVVLGLNLTDDLMAVRCDALHRPAGPSEAWIARRAADFYARLPQEPLPMPALASASASNDAPVTPMATRQPWQGPTNGHTWGPGDPNQSYSQYPNPNGPNASGVYSFRTAGVSSSRWRSPDPAPAMTLAEDERPTTPLPAVRPPSRPAAPARSSAHHQKGRAR